MRLLSTSILLLIVASVSPVPTFAASEQQLTCMPFAGETMTFEVGWEFINAGTAKMTVRRKGRDSYLIDTFAKTNKFFDIFKKVRDRIVSEGICRDKKPQSTIFDLTQHENTYHAVKKTRFLWRKGEVEYILNDKVKTFKVPAGYLNVMDAFYTVRRMPLKVGEVIRIPVFDSGKKYDIEVNVLKTEYQFIHGISGKGKRVQCLVISPHLKSEAIFSSVGTMKIWLTNDPQHIPVLMIAKIKIGHIVARLIDYQPAPAR